MNYSRCVLSNLFDPLHKNAIVTGDVRIGFVNENEIVKFLKVNKRRRKGNRKRAHHQPSWKLSRKNEVASLGSVIWPATAIPGQFIAICFHFTSLCEEKKVYTPKMRVFFFFRTFIPDRFLSVFKWMDFQSTLRIFKNVLNWRFDKSIDIN